MGISLSVCFAKNVITVPILETLNYALGVFSVCSNLVGLKKTKYPGKFQMSVLRYLLVGSSFVHFYIFVICFISTSTCIYLCSTFKRNFVAQSASQKLLLRIKNLNTETYIHT